MKKKNLCEFKIKIFFIYLFIVPIIYLFICFVAMFIVFIWKNARAHRARLVQCFGPKIHNFKKLNQTHSKRKKAISCQFVREIIADASIVCEFLKCSDIVSCCSCTHNSYTNCGRQIKAP